MSIIQNFEELKRVRHIVNILFSEGFGYAIEKMRLKSHLKFRHQIEKVGLAKVTSSLPERIRKVLERAGGVYIKLGQMLSVRYDLIPAEYCDEFSKLQDSVKPLSFQKIKTVIEKEYGKPLSAVFKSFDKKPIAAASVGQVHRAVLKSGKVVAVKIQRPNIQKAFRSDIKVLYYLAALADKNIPELRIYNLPSIVKEFEEYTLDELNYLTELKNLEIFYNIYKEHDKIKVPKPYPAFCTKKILVMEFIKGTKISSIEDFKKYHTTPKKMMRTILQSFTDQILDYSVFHADPHPGNMFITKKGEVALLDFGIVGKPSKEQTEHFQDIIISIVNKDLEGLSRSILNLGLTEESIDPKMFKKDLAKRLAKYYGLPLKQVAIREFLISIINLSKKHKIILPLDFILLFKCLITLEAITRKYYPQFNLVQFVEPKIKKIIIQRKSPVYLYSQFKTSFNNLKDFLEEIPSDVKTIVNTFKNGSKTNVEVEQLREFTLEIDRSSNRLTLGLVLASLIVSSAIIIQTDLKPEFKGIPLLGWITMILSIIIGLSLMLSIFREDMEVNK